jgi:hypothetical protein
MLVSHAYSVIIHTSKQNEEKTMSMNLVFTDVTQKLSIDFPFQTPTDLTYAVLDEKDQEKQLDLIRAYCLNNMEYSIDELNEVMNKIRVWLAYPLYFDME